MREEEFRKFLEGSGSITSKDKAVSSRMSRGRRVEDTFNVDLDSVVVTDESMYQLLIKIQNELNDNHATIQNSVRKYYLFVKGREFPSIASYEKRRKIS